MQRNMRPLVIRREDRATSGFVLWLWCREERRRVGFIDVRTEEYGMWRIAFVEVEPEYRKKGYGTRLMLHVERMARNCRGIERLELENCLDNPSRSFYHRMGYRYVDPDDNAMVKRL